MSNPTSNFNWQMPTATDLVTDLPADFEVFGQAVDTSLADLKGGTTGQILAKNTNADMDFVWVANDVGDITAVTAGTGISGGGTSGAVTVTNSMATEITAKGDLIVGTGNATFDNLPAGTNGYVLTADSTVSPTGLKWSAAGDGGGDWTTYTPTITAEVGTATSVTSQAGRYQMLNSKTCLVQAVWRVADKGTAVGETYFTLPFTSKNAGPSATGVAREIESAGVMGWVDNRVNQNYCRTSGYAMGTWWVNNYTVKAQIVFEVA
jgi:hypothetical protein